MIGYSAFEEQVKQLCNNYEDWQHILPSVPLELRRRYIEVIKRHVNMPDAFDYVLITKNIPDEKFYSRLMDRETDQEGL